MRKMFRALYARILESDIQDALVLAQVYGGLLWAIDVDVYEAADLERHLVAQCLGRVQIPDIPKTRDLYLHVVSEPYHHGGHTRLMERLAGMHEEPVDLLVSRQVETSVHERLSDYFRCIEVAQGEQALERLQSIVDVLVRYEKVVLHLHPDDIVTIVACGLIKRALGKRFTVFFVNHADHAFNFSASVADYYFELSSYGHQIDKKRGLSARKCFLGIPIGNGLQGTLKPVEGKQGIKVFSAASAIKFKPSGGLDIRPSVRALLSKFPDAQLWVVGANPLTNTWWWPIKLRYPRRFFMMRHMPYAEYMSLVEQADFYMDSYPLPGGTAFAEQVLKGQRCIGLIGPMPGYTPAERLKVETVDQLLDTVEHPRDAVFDEVVSQIIESNGEQAVRARYLACVKRGECSSNPLIDTLLFRGDIDFLRVRGRIGSMIPVTLLDTLYRYDRRLAIDLVCGYRMWPGMKLAAKWLLVNMKRHWA